MKIWQARNLQSPSNVIAGCWDEDDVVLTVLEVDLETTGDDLEAIRVLLRHAMDDRRQFEWQWRRFWKITSKSQR